MEGWARSNIVEKTKVFCPTQRLIPFVCILSTIFLSSCVFGFEAKTGEIEEEPVDEEPETDIFCSDDINCSTDNPNDSGNSWENDPLFEESGLPSVIDDLDEEACDSMGSQLEHPGATSYFVGTYIKEGNTWIGREKWILFPNEFWEASGGFPCEVSWDMTIQEEELITCLACDFALDVDAAISASSTNCPQDLWNSPSEQYWNTTYEVLKNNGISTFYFQSNGNAFGSGYASETAINFVSEPDCKWF